MPDFDGGIARLLRIVRQDAGHQLQVALVRPPRRERFGQLQRDVRPVVALRASTMGDRP